MTKTLFIPDVVNLGSENQHIQRPCCQLNKATSDEITWCSQHYTGRGAAKLRVWCIFGPGYGSACLEDASLKTAQNPDGGPFPAYLSGESRDEASGKTDSTSGARDNSTWAFLGKQN